MLHRFIAKQELAVALGQPFALLEVAFAHKLMIDAYVLSHVVFYLGRRTGGIDDNLVYGLDVLLCQTEEVQVYAVIFGEFAQPVVVEIFQQWNQHPLVSQTKEKFVWENIRHSI